MFASHAARFKTARLLLCSFGELSQTPSTLLLLHVGRFLHREQIWIAVYTWALIIIVEKKLQLESSRYEMGPVAKT